MTHTDRSRPRPRVIVVETQPLLRDALSSLLAAANVAATGYSGALDGVEAALQAQAPDAVVLGLGPAAASTALLHQLPRLAAQWRTLVVLSSDEPGMHARLVALGAMGVVTLDQASGAFVSAVRKVAAGELWLDRVQVARVLESMRGRGFSDDPARSAIAALTGREREIVDLVAEGLTNDLIAGRLRISPATVRNHLTSVLNKLDLPDRFQLAVFAFRRGLAWCAPTPAMLQAGREWTERPRRLPRARVSALVIAAALTWPCTAAPIRAAAQEQPAPLTAQQQLEAAEAALDPMLIGRYRLAPSDVLELIFPYVPEFSQTVTVLPDGYITLRDVGELRVLGRTMSELRPLLLEAYERILVDPVISIVLKDFEKPYFVAAGAVNKPGKIELRGATTVTQAIALAGGLAPVGKLSQVIVFRRYSPELLEVKEINVKEMFDRKDLSEDLLLRAGDTVFIPTSLLARIERFIARPQLGLYLNPFARYE
jgi:polysaccharide export outer membrane protein